MLPLFLFFYLSSIGASVGRHFFINNNDKIFHSLTLASSAFWHLRSIFLLFYILFGIIFVYQIYRGNVNKRLKLTLLVSFVLCFVSFLLCSVFLQQESRNYTNYLYATYGLFPADLSLTSNIAVFTIAVLLTVIFTRKQFLGNEFETFFSKKTILFFTVFFGLASLFWYIEDPLLKFNDYLGYASGGYSARFENYSAIKTLADYTKTQDVIILPPQSGLWSDIGNPPIVRYFLYPRLLVSSSDLNSKVAVEINNAYYVELGKTGEENHWPRINIGKEEVIFNIDPIKYRQLESMPTNNGFILYHIYFSN